MKYIVTLNGKNYEVDVTKTDAVITSVSPVASAAPVAPVVPVASAAPAAPAAPVATAAPVAPTADGTKVTSPMPGNILAVNVSAGQAVKEGDVMFILEAMKMENEIVAPASGTVKQVLVSKGAVVETDAVLAVL